MGKMCIMHLRFGFYQEVLFKDVISCKHTTDSMMFICEMGLKPFL